VSFPKEVVMVDIDFKDRRTFERFSLAIPLSYSKLKDAGKSYILACDISAEGLGIISDNKVAPGSSVCLYLQVPDINKELPISGKVVWFKKLGNSFRVGLSLDQNELMEVSAILRFLHVCTV
jgi:Tfp pilus assembly protein PilZ